MATFEVYECFFSGERMTRAEFQALLTGIQIPMLSPTGDFVERTVPYNMLSTLCKDHVVSTLSTVMEPIPTPA